MTRWEIAGFLTRAAFVGTRNRRALREVERFCFLVGYPRSGSTLYGSLLNAHPEMVIAHEADSFRYVRPGITRTQFYGMLLDRDRQFAGVGRRWNGFDYVVEDGDQGRFTRLRVIGDKHAGRAARRLAEDPARLDRLRSLVGVPLRVVHLARNPYDVVASISRNRDIALVRAIDIYRELGPAVDGVRDRLSVEELLELRYEDVTVDPARALADTCRFLGVEASATYLRTAAALVDNPGRPGRDTVRWSEAERDQVQEIIDRRPILAGYTFD
jgi:Sulfotransferase family